MQAAGAHPPSVGRWGGGQDEDLLADHPTLAPRFTPQKHSQPELCANPEEDWVQRLMRLLDQPPTLRKAAKGCRKDKSGKKGKGSKGCKR